MTHPHPLIVEYKGKSYMARKRRKAPTDPAEIARRRLAERGNPATWGPNEDALRLASNANVADEPETRNKVRRVCRFDVFALLKARNELDPGPYSAVRRLQDDIAILHRTTGTTPPSRVTAHTTAQADGMALSRIRAGERIAAAEAGTGAHSWKILTALCEPEIIDGRLNNWRAVVQRVTGEHRPMPQAALVKAAAYSLSEAYGEIDGARKRA